MECTIRPASSTDVERLIEIQHSEPSAVIVGLAGSVERGRRLGAAMLHATGVTDPARPCVVCEINGVVAGFAQYSIGDSDAMPMNLRLVSHVIRALGPRVLFLPRRLAALKTVRLAVPPDSFYIAEIHVHPAQRGSGIGGRLLHWLEDEATKQHRPMMSLVTDIENPARRLYERHGFEVRDTRADPRFGRSTGQSGRVLMTKPIAGSCGRFSADE